jgi:Holliday junction DNA helicase RuvB
MLFEYKSRKELKMSAIRPQKLTDFLGQASIVERINIAVKSALDRDVVFPHMIMGGPPGLGKTTIAKIIANEMNGKLISRISTAITKPEDLVDLFKQIDNVNTFIFIDEIEQLDRKITELFHTAMEDFKFSAKLGNGKIVEIKLPEFTLLGATNYLGELPRPFLDRFKIKVNFEPYNDDEIKNILINTVKRMKITATKEGVEEIARRSRGIPRIAISYLEHARDVSIAIPNFDKTVSTHCVFKAFEVNEVDEIGLTNLDRRILHYLSQNDRSIGVKALAQAVDEDVSTVEMSEGYLVRTQMIQKTAKGREITDAGREHMERFKKCKS